MLSVDQFLGSGQRRTVIVPTNCDCARARAKLTVYQRSPSSGSATSNGQWSDMRSIRQSVAISSRWEW